MTSLQETNAGARAVARYEELCSDEDLSALNEQLCAATSALGFEFTLLCTMPPAAPPNAAAFVTNYSRDWMRHYLRNNFRTHDLVAINAAQLRRPFLWSDVQDRRNLTKAQSRLIDEARTFGLRLGGTIVSTAPDGRLSTLNVSSRLSPQDFAKLFVARRRELEDLHLMSSRKLTQIAAKTSAPQPGLASDKPPFRLTQHENEALVFAARGLPREQIAAAMGISRSTVRAHLGNAMEKLKARNIAHAVAIAMAASVIWP